MANILAMEKKIMAVSALAEGASIRSIERMTGIHRDTIMRLGIRMGEGCARLMDSMMRGLNSKYLQLDEIWGYIGKKHKNASIKDQAKGLGDAWTFVAIDADSKVVPCYRVGKRDSETANAFVIDLADCLKNRVQISTDALKAYADAIERGFGPDVDYGQIVKSYSTPDESKGKYSPARLVSVKKAFFVGNPDKDQISTSFIERQNLTMRMHCRRLTRLTNAFSKKLENFKAAIGLHFGYYNFVKVHNTLRITPAMAGGVTPKVWSIAELIERAE